MLSEITRPPPLAEVAWVCTTCPKPSDNSTDVTVDRDVPVEVWVRVISASTSS